MKNALFTRLRATTLFKFADSLFGQILLIVAAGVILLQLANFFVVCNVQYLYIQQAEASRAEHFAAIATLFSTMPAEHREGAVESLLHIRNNAKLAAQERNAAYSVPPGENIRLLREAPSWVEENNGAEPERQLERIRAILSVDEAYPPVVHARRLGSDIEFPPLHFPSLEVAVALPDGEWLLMTSPYDVDDREVVWLQRLFVLLDAVVMLFVAVIFLKRVTKPMVELGRAVEDFGIHPETAEPIAERGVREIRSVATAFNRMRERIRGNFAERDRMIAAMAHDLRTPLTKLQLRLDRVEPESLREKLLATVSSLTDIITQGVAFAKSLNTNEAPARLELRSFLESIAADYADIGQNVSLADDDSAATTHAVANVRPLCLRRAVENLISNACKYGGGAATLRLLDEDDAYVIEVADNGPGIPAPMLEKVFEPYFRLESSRNRLSGGTGLGLAIARNMTLLNNGMLTLENRPEGGLAAKIRLPKQK